MHEPHPADQPRLIATAAELATMAAAVEPDALVFIDDAQIEPGSNPADHTAWAIVAQRRLALANDAGQVAGPGEQVSTPDEQGQHQLLSTPVLTLTERRLATPGIVGPVAHPADPDIRRADAYHDRKDQDLTRYLMELLDAVERLRSEAEHYARDQDRQFHPMAGAQLANASAHLQQAREAVDRATAYGTACELVRGIHLGRAGTVPCDAEHLYEALVWLPGLEYEKLACTVHAAAAEHTIPGAKSRPNPNARYGDPHPDGQTNS